MNKSLSYLMVKNDFFVIRKQIASKSQKHITNTSIIMNLKAICK